MESPCGFQNLFYAFFFYCFVTCSAGDEDKQLLVTVPSGKVTRRVADDLNLTCRVYSDTKFYVSWRIPQNKQLQADRIRTEDSFNEQSVTIYQLRDFDAGIYSCIARYRDTVLRKDILVSIASSEQKACFEHSFVCGNGYCIPKRYACDGHMDCPDGSDESKSSCGPDPCEDKVLCDDGRCIPQTLCCDPAVDMSCQLTYLQPCCKQYLASIATEALLPSKSGGALPPHRRYSGGVDYLQSSVYTVVSCAVVFIFVATIMVAAICRIHMRRSAMAMFPSHIATAAAAERQRFLPWCQHTHHAEPRFTSRPSTGGNSPVPYSTDLHTVTCSHGSYVVAAYSSSHDKVHFFQHLPKPPEYSPVADDPPPPYSSVDDLRAVADEADKGESPRTPPDWRHLCSASVTATSEGGATVPLLTAVEPDRELWRDDGTSDEASG